MSQLKMVIDELEKTGEVSRNWALSNYISRLSAIIYILRYEYDWSFQTFKMETERPDGSKGWDYIYKVVVKGKNPYKKDKK